MIKERYWPQHVAISVANLEETMRWYEKMFGFEVQSKEYVVPCHSMVATLSNGSFELEIFQHDHSVPLAEGRKSPELDPMEQGVKHLCFGTDALEALITELREKGVEVIIGPEKMGDRTIYYIHDNSGNLIELMQ